MDAIDALLWGYQIKKLRHFRMHPEMIGNFSPVGYVRVDSNGLVGIFNIAGGEVFHVNSFPSVIFEANSNLAVVPKYGNSGITTVGIGLPAIYGLDNRAGVTAADGGPIVLYTAGGANQLYDAAIEIDATSFTSGTATYTMTYTENGVSQTIVVTATAINVVTGIRRLIQPDAATLITIQLTGVFVATLRLSAVVMQLA